MTRDRFVTRLLVHYRLRKLKGLEIILAIELFSKYKIVPKDVHMTELLICRVWSVRVREGQCM